MMQERRARHVKPERCGTSSLSICLVPLLARKTKYTVPFGQQQSELMWWTGEQAVELVQLKIQETIMCASS